MSESESSYPQNTVETWLRKGPGTGVVRIRRGDRELRGCVRALEVDPNRFRASAWDSAGWVHVEGVFDDRWAAVAALSKRLMGELAKEKGES